MRIVSTRATDGLVDAIAAGATRIGALEQLAGGADAGAPTDEPLGLVPEPLGVIQVPHRRTQGREERGAAADGPDLAVELVASCGRSRCGHERRLRVTRHRACGAEA